MPIKGMDVATHDIIVKLNELDYEFFLTGSRYFTPDKVNGDTDYDFFVNTSPQVMKELSELGFYDIARSTYIGTKFLPMDIDCIYRLKCCPGIDIILTSYPDERKQAQQVIKQFNIKNQKDKEVWDQLLYLALGDRIEM